MGVGTIHTRELDGFVAECDRLGGIATPAAAKYVEGFGLRFDTRVDPSLDPFSDAYFAQQKALYTELAGRELDQETGEQTPLDAAANVGGCNPYNSRDVGLIARHARTIHTCLMMADLPAGASVLDAGSGWGLSSEAMAFCGADVTAVDINPRFVELVRRRAERLGLPVTAVHSQFDTFDTDRRFDLLLFYECLHHSLRPWETVARLGRFVKAGGKVVIAGEPVNAIWWPHWGLRLDALSVYCVRKFGWWESGWSAGFLAVCFAKAGFALTLYPDGAVADTYIGVAARSGPVVAPARPDLAAVASAPAPLDPVALWAENVALRHALEDMRTSRSWRLTAPMRFLFRTLGVSRG